MVDMDDPQKPSIGYRQTKDGYKIWPRGQALNFPLELCGGRASPSSPTALPPTSIDQALPHSSDLLSEEPET